MPDERRYPDEEIREIFELAATPRDAAAGGAASRAVTAADGLTLAELQAIGREAGLDPAHVAEAAATLELRRGALPRQTSFGLPVGVSRVVTLPRAPTDREWAQLVAELRATFDARGADRSLGETRQWSNGNLHAYVEPEGEGHRLRLRTRKGDAASLVGLGAVGLVMGLLLLVVQVTSGGGDTGALFAALVLALAGGATVGHTALRLPRWAEERERQMERVAARATALLAAPPSPPAGRAPPAPPAHDPDAGRAGDAPR